MGKYDGWDAFFERLEGDEHVFTFDQLEDLIEGTLPASAHRHQAWWSNAQYNAKWVSHGWFASADMAAKTVAFRRQPPTRGRGRRPRPRREPDADPAPASQEPRLVLVGCVAQKRTTFSPARDLYISDLWTKRRRYAESTGRPWMILSAEHGLVAPEEVIEPYDRHLESQPASYKYRWSRLTAQDVIASCRELGLDRVEIHAGSAYIDNGLAAAVEDAGIAVDRPLRGMRIGEQLRWYRAGGGVAADIPASSSEAAIHQPRRPVADIVERVAATFRSGDLGQSWDDLPEVWHLPETDGRSARLWVTFVAAVNRARDVGALWSRALVAWERDPWIFDPTQIGARTLADLADTLRLHGLTQRHGPDSHAWRMIAEAMADSRCPAPISRAIDGEPVEAADVLSALETRWPHGTPMFPHLSGAKIAPMWIRMLVYPGGSPITGMEVVPVAVDTHVQRVTEMLGLVPVRKLDDRHRRRVQRAWFAAVENTATFGAPPGLDGTAAGLDPALWALGKEGCSRCERERRRIPIGPICDVCLLGRVS